MYPKTYFDLFPPFPLTNRVFVAISFDEAFDHRWSNIIKPAISSVSIDEVSLEPHRTDVRVVSDSVLTEIENEIATARLIFVDITTIEIVGDTAIRNGNVMYELGLAHATRLPEEVIIFRSDNDPLPFDTANVRVNPYDPDNDPEAAIEKVQHAVRNALSEIKLVRHKIVSQLVAQFDTSALMMLSDAATPAGLRPPPKKNMGDVISNMTRSSTLMRMLDRGLIIEELVEASASTWDANEGIGRIDLDDLQVYRITPLGKAVRDNLAKKLAPSLAPFVAQYESPKDTPE
jgi:hypothetical protein